jgi:hypothetical protein
LLSREDAANSTWCCHFLVVFASARVGSDGGKLAAKRRASDCERLSFRPRLGNAGTSYQRPDPFWGRYWTLCHVRRTRQQVRAQAAALRCLRPADATRSQNAAIWRAAGSLYLPMRGMRRTAYRGRRSDGPIGQSWVVPCSLDRRSWSSRRCRASERAMISLHRVAMPYPGVNGF